MANISLSEYGKFISLQNNSGSANAEAPAGGLYLFASGAVGSARLFMQNEGGVITDVAKSLDIDAFDALGGTGLHQTQDHFVFSDNGTEKKITFSNLEDAIFGNISGDATVAAGGDLSLGVAAITNQTAMTGDLDDADELLINDGGALKRVDFSVVRDAVFADVSGDATVAAGGALTIGAGAVEEGMLNDNVISGQDELAHADIADADEFLISDGGTLKRVGVDSLQNHYYGNVSGDATVADGGALTIAADAVEGSMLNDNVISGQTELAQGSLAAADELLLSDGGVIKRYGVDSLAKDSGALVDEAALAVGDDYILFLDGGASGETKKEQLSDVVGNMAGNGLAAASGVLSVGVSGSVVLDGDKVGLSGSVAGTGLTFTGGINSIATLALDIDELTAKGDASLHQTQDNFLVSDNGTEKKITFSNLEDAIFGNVSGDVLVAAGGAATIQADAVEGSMLNDNVISGQTELAHADIVDADELMISDGGTLKKVGVDSLQNHYFGNVSGDASIADGGAVTLAAAQTNVTSLLATDIKIGEDDQTKIDFETADQINFYANNGLRASLTANGFGTGGGAGAGGASIGVDGTGNFDGGVFVGQDGSGAGLRVHGAAANEEMIYVAAENKLQFKKDESGSQETIMSLGGDENTDFAIEVANGSDNINKIKAAAFVTYSDESLKSDVTSMGNTALDAVMSLNGVEFTWKDSGERDFGFIAQDVQKVVPKAVHTGGDGVQGVDYSRLTSVLVEAVKAQQVQIEELKALLKK